MSSLFVGNEDEEDEYNGNDINNIVLENTQRPPPSINNDNDDDGSSNSIPVVIEDNPIRVQPVYESREISCTLPLQFHQDVVEDMLTKDGLLILGRGLGWEIITANLLYALSSPSVSLITGDRQQKKKSLVILLNAKEEENIKLGDELTDLFWINSTINDNQESNSDEESEKSPFTVIGGEISTADKRKRLYENGGCVSVTSRVFVVDLLSGIISPNDITGLLILHAEKIKETSNESFIVNLYRDTNDWGFIKAISDEPESFTGFTPLATKLKVLRLGNTFLWPRFHVEVSSSLSLKNKLSRSQKEEADKGRFVTEINVQLSYKMNKIQAAILSCLASCLQELKRHNPTLATEYWDMENIHDANFVPRVRLSLDSQWHRISWTSKQLVYDLTTLKDLLKNLLTVDSLTFYQMVQNIIDLNVKTLSSGSMFTTSMSPWLNLDEANTVISYAKDRALAKIKVSKKKSSNVIDVDNIGAEDELNDDQFEVDEEYNLEELPKWDQLGLLLDDIMFEKSTFTNSKNDGPILIMCSTKHIVRQLSSIIPKMKKEENRMTGKKRFSSRKYMVYKLNDYLEWKELSKLTKQLNVELDKPPVDVNENPVAGDEDLQTSKTFSRGKGHPLSKRRRTRGAAAIANVNKLYSGSVQERNTEAVELDESIMQHLKSSENVDVDDDDDTDNHDDDDDDGDLNEKEVIDVDDDDPTKIEEENLFIQDEDEITSGGFLPEETNSEFQILQNYNRTKSKPALLFEHVDKFDQIIVEKYNERTNDALLQEISPSYIIMYEPNLSFIRRVEIYQAINKETPARTYFMYYGTSVEEQSHLLRIKKEKDAFTKLIREKASLSKNFKAETDNWRFQIQKLKVVNTRIAGGSNFRTGDEEMMVIVDVREFRSSLPNLLYRVGIKVVPCMITVGDYIISPKICVERKAIPDLISSFKSGRLYVQCEQMFRHYEIPTLLIEFDENQSFSFEPFSELRNYKINATNPVATKLMQQEIQSKLIMLLIAFPKLKIIWSSSPYETAQIFLELKANQEEPDIGTAIAKGVNTLIKSIDGDPPMFNDDAIDLIQNIPGINNVNYYTIIQKVKSIEELVKLSKDDLTGMIGEENGTKAFNFINHSVK